MPGRRKGMERRIRYGVKGPKMETLVKTVAKKVERAAERACKKYRNVGAREYVIIKRFRIDTGMALSRGLDAAGFDPKKPSERKIRAEIQKMGQKFSDLNYRVLFDPKYKRDPNAYHEMQQPLAEMVRIVTNAKGLEGLKNFNDAFVRAQKNIQIAHEEVKENIEKRQKSEK